MERLLWKGPYGLCVWSVDDDATGGDDNLYRVTRYGVTLSEFRSMRDVFTFLHDQHAVA